MTREVGIETLAYFMTGYLNETREAFGNTMSLIKTIKADQIMMTLATPYPKTLLERQAIAANKMPKDYWKNYILGQINEPLPPLASDSIHWIKEAYHTFHFNPRYLLGRVKRITSVRQMKKHILAGIGVLFFKLR